MLPTKKAALAVVAAAMSLGLTQATHALTTWTSNSGTTIDFTQDGNGSIAVNGSNYLVMTPTDGTSNFGARALASVSATDAALFATVGTANVVANNVQPYLKVSYIERAYIPEADQWRGQEIFVNGTGGGSNNNRFQTGSLFGTGAGATGLSGGFDIKRSTGAAPSADQTAYVSSSYTVADAGSGAPNLGRQDNVAHTMTITRQLDGSLKIVFDGLTFDSTTAPVAMNVPAFANNGGVKWGFDQLELRVRNGAYSGAVNNQYIWTDLEFGLLPIPEPASAMLLVSGGLLLLKRRRTA
jgi:hypothetical protein